MCLDLKIAGQVHSRRGHGEVGAHYCDSMFGCSTRAVLDDFFVVAMLLGGDTL